MARGGEGGVLVRAAAGLRVGVDLDRHPEVCPGGEPKAVLIGVRESAWALALQGLKGFIFSGWGDQARLLGWTAAELYRVPPVWARVDLCGAALLIGDRRWR